MGLLKLFRCGNPACKDRKTGKFHDFASEQPVCDLCGIEANDEKYGHLIIRLVRVHFDPPSKVPGIGLTVRACNPRIAITAMTEGDGPPTPWHAGTGDVDCVTCPECRATPAWEQAHMDAHDETKGGDRRAALARLAMLPVAAG